MNIKTATYNLIAQDGTRSKTRVEYDADAPCVICGEPVLEASMGGTAICSWCDCGRCRYGCGAKMFVFKEELDGGRSLRAWREHMAWHKQPPPAKEGG